MTQRETSYAWDDRTALAYQVASTLSTGPDLRVLRFADCRDPLHTSRAGRRSRDRVEVRIGLHTAECEVSGEKLPEVAVHIGARVAGKAHAGDVVVSQMVNPSAGCRFRRQLIARNWENDTHRHRTTRNTEHENAESDPVAKRE